MTRTGVPTVIVEQLVERMRARFLEECRARADGLTGFPKLHDAELDRISNDLDRELAIELAKFSVEGSA